MKTWQLGLALILFAALGGAVGGLSAAWLHRSSAKTAEEPAPEAGAEEDGTPNRPAEDDPELDALRGRVAALERRVSLLTAALARGQEAPAGDEAEAGPNLRETDVADPVFEAAVLDIMDRERERADGERDARRTDLRTQRVQRVSDALTASLGLDDAQKAKMAELITAHFDALRALRSDDNPERPVTPREWREKAAEIDKRLQDALAQALTPKQLAAYQALDPDDQIGGGFGRGRPRAPAPPAEASTSAR